MKNSEAKGISKGAVLVMDGFAKMHEGFLAPEDKFKLKRRQRHRNIYGNAYFSGSYCDKTVVHEK